MGFICSKCGRDANTAKRIAPNEYQCLDCYEDIMECYCCHKIKPVTYCQWFDPWTSNYPDNDYGSVFYHKNTCYVCDKCRKKYNMDAVKRK